MIKLTRLSDDKEFVIDDENKEWRATQIEGIDALTTNVYTETPAIGSGEIVTGKYIGRRDITIIAHRSSQTGISTARETVMEFFNPDDTYIMEIQYNGKTRYINCELLSYKLPTENIYRPIDLTFTMLCLNPYFYEHEYEIPFWTSTVILGQIAVNPSIIINQNQESGFVICIDDNDPIQIDLEDKYHQLTHTLALDGENGVLIDNDSGDYLTKYILSGNPTIVLKPGRHTIDIISTIREVGTATIINSDYSVTVNTGGKIYKLTIKSPDDYEATYSYTDEQITHNNYAIDFHSSGFTIHGPRLTTITYTAYTVTNNRSIYIKYKTLYRGF